MPRYNICAARSAFGSAFAALVRKRRRESALVCAPARRAMSSAKQIRDRTHAAAWQLCAATYTHANATPQREAARARKEVIMAAPHAGYRARRKALLSVQMLKTNEYTERTHKVKARRTGTVTLCTPRAGAAAETQPPCACCATERAALYKRAAHGAPRCARVVAAFTAQRTGAANRRAKQNHSTCSLHVSNAYNARAPLYIQRC